ncbi:sigma-B regulation protein RsbU (phosphoserine phosphatase) [Oikeobacillus pervagus]|uniref:Sigma-B regulation protein RsbU (Phosphoserine phosphatase) n=1 Tax=Oikeobacillus pervagus TaxID=1325931 RepID=A0AAJ1T653_9BACI|nr:PP2C family protein-serine/threonine phosphatase [Oikeobacillus pervagus]MDQ0216594.1 sigma-B regulation protein RsbU (phosphoserine phosphatase) [Oikeobacillus pervagus]
MSLKEVISHEYNEIIKSYLEEQTEQALYLSQKFSRKLIEQHVSPEEIISLHKNALLKNEPNISLNVLHSFDILLEVMMGYGLAYREHQSLRSIQQELKTEIEVAANMQQTLLGTTIPQIEGLDIGAISVPAKQMSGDYYHFVQDEDGSLSIAIADIIGKGIPAALCMSMIKYAMDSLPDHRYYPSSVLSSLNRVVEQNVDPSMFISMFYGLYEMDEHLFHFSSAGHEPGFYFEASTQIFTELKAKGLLLGVDKKSRYRQYKKKIAPGDMIILLSDGVTECRINEGFIERETLIEYIKKYIHLKSQDIVNKIYKELEALQDFQLRDDFTLIILKRDM